MKKITSDILPIIALAVILSPVAASLLKGKPEPVPVPVVSAPVPKPAPKETDPAARFAAIRPRYFDGSVQFTLLLLLQVFFDEPHRGFHQGFPGVVVLVH